MSASYMTWSLDKLKKESVKIEKAIKQKELQDKKRVLAELRSVAKKHGFTLSDFMATEPKSAVKQTDSKSNGKASTPGASQLAKKSPGIKKRAKAKIKYRNPTNKNDTWTGRGRQPRWVAQHIESGGSLQQIEV